MQALENKHSESTNIEKHYKNLFSDISKEQLHRAVRITTAFVEEGKIEGLADALNDENLLMRAVAEEVLRVITAEK